MKKVWWKESIAYQIYPRSFQDSNNDGIGDIQGIISRLDYIKDLGIDIIWICPMFKSPNDDNGYDISDYEDVMEDFGTMEDFDELLKEVHSRDMKLILDLVVNHTSDEHPWFIESRSSKDNDKRDWYIWKEGKEGQEPNNWESIFNESAWEYDENTKEYYLHLFSKKQPDLNWENEDVRKEVYKMINGWLDKGIDGFRVDAISHIKKDLTFEDMPNPNNLRYVSSFDKHMNVDGIHELLEDINSNTFSKYDIVTVGEANGVKAEEAVEWVGEDSGKFSMLFQFEHLELWQEDEKTDGNKVKNLKDTLTRWQNALDKDGWNALFIENHDIPRSVSSWGNDEKYWKESSKAYALMYFMQKGTPFIYQGQEIGMTNVHFDSIEDYDDIKCVNLYKSKVKNGVDKEAALRLARSISRDNARTPMQWDDSENSGFTKGSPWLKVNDNYKDINVKAQIKDEDSVLNFYKKMCKLKKESQTLIYGRYDLILEDHEDIYAYTRTLEDDKYIIITNLSEKEVKYAYDKENLKYENLILSNYKVDEHQSITEFNLKPYEARLYKI
ncbi:alpha-glucosidase [uncultured Clostridium sp.]|uniref:glycoside hydrolase family 13 protein n=1 Tax=uncultured Clostridium sp. TaxID=59620 RepID=UPI0025EF9575|nr:alpha-glucosidase [uncultured Clostridium sp.]